MFITLFFISFSFLQTACFLLNNIQQQKLYRKQTNIEFLLSNKYMTRQTKKKYHKKKTNIQISNRKYCKTPGRTSSMHPISQKNKLTICAQNTNFGRRN